ncbi:2-dehydro-3-deoxygalactonokinase [Massilia genomosp. 1]|uniref:2-dehydro-3-deoxygalactonokinase n=1 Tax=Massilia genomosp. 1 TaxID=2609280 RepID=A0ABX0N3E1_9BURK|nr:2-dehydro-3-deoxygalactonokinase [Massilia genomosp. 1]NHZ66382.1 2-dehydro-3-deoxygalactonokinase [Massilia genomosp. 1]
MHTQLLGIDWGSSNRRAYLVRRDGKCLARHADDQGMLAVGGDFAGALASLRERMGVAPGVAVVMSGMVGSASGWQEVPYLDTNVPLTGLPAHLAGVAGHPGCFIVPGYCTRDGAVDVMRGEETQLLGAVGRGLLDGWVVLPGTHSKWVYLRAGKVDQLVTYMTGELFSMLAAGGTLAALMAGALDDDSAFAAGLQEARRARALSNALFGARARVVSKTMAAAQARSFVSGLLIGAEFVAAQGHADGAIDIIGSPLLAAHYERAAAHFGMPARVHDPDDVYLAALAYFFESV